uniref:RING-type domain-containing protein n=1 Tax=Syphacia muris TaxID=451379 RepID=A0A0N5B1D4_9BILA
MCWLKTKRQSRTAVELTDEERNEAFEKSLSEMKIFVESILTVNFTLLISVVSKAEKNLVDLLLKQRQLYSVGVMDPKMECRICFDIPVDPVGCCSCKQLIGCRECLSQWLMSDGADNQMQMLADKTSLLY